MDEYTQNAREIIDENRAIIATLEDKLIELELKLVDMDALASQNALFREALVSVRRIACDGDFPYSVRVNMMKHLIDSVIE